LIVYRGLPLNLRTAVSSKTAVMNTVAVKPNHQYSVTVLNMLTTAVAALLRANSGNSC
jgi:hypothetical protein